MTSLDEASHRDILAPCSRSHSLNNDIARRRPDKAPKLAARLLTWSTNDDSYSFARPGRAILCGKASSCFPREALDLSRASRSCREYCRVRFTGTVLPLETGWLFCCRMNLNISSWSMRVPG